MSTFREAVVNDFDRARRRLSRIENKIDDINGGRAPRDRDLADCRDLTNRLEATFNSLEMTVPAPMPTDSYRSYRADVLSRLQGVVPDKNLSGIDLHKMSRADDSAAVMDHLEREIVSAANRVAANPTQGSFRNPGQMREVPVRDQSGRTWTEFRGSPSTWMNQFMYPARCVTGGLLSDNPGRRWS